MTENKKDHLIGTPIMIPGPPSRMDRIKELVEVALQYKFRHNRDDMQEHLDKNMVGLFDKLIMMSGGRSMRQEIEDIKESIGPSIIFHKKHFNQLRPAELAKSVGIDLMHDSLSSASSPSYPSGHAAQAFYLAHCLSDIFPGLSRELYAIANMVSESRIDRGVHFPADIEGGKALARKMYMIKKKRIV